MRASFNSRLKLKKKNCCLILSGSQKKQQQQKQSRIMTIKKKIRFLLLFSGRCKSWGFRLVFTIYEMTASLNAKISAMLFWRTCAVNVFWYLPVHVPG